MTLPCRAKGNVVDLPNLQPQPWRTLLGVGNPFFRLVTNGVTGLVGSCTCFGLEFERLPGSPSSAPAFGLSLVLTVLDTERRGYRLCTGEKVLRRCRQFISTLESPGDNLNGLFYILLSFLACNTIFASTSLGQKVTRT